MNIRPATLADCATLAQIQVDSYRSAYRDILPAEYLAQFDYSEQAGEWRDWQISHPEDILLVAEDDSGEVTAYGLARPGATQLPPYDGEVLAIHVRSQRQRQGIGRALFVEAARQLHQAGCRSLLVWVLEANRPACLFYERMGGTWIGRREVELGEEAARPTRIAYGWLRVANIWE